MSQSIILDADQWIENGYVYRDGRIHPYETDRKEQTYREFGSMTVEEFLTDEKLSPEIRHWAQALPNA